MKWNAIAEKVTAWFVELRDTDGVLDVDLL